MMVSALSHSDYQRMHLNLRLQVLISKLQDWVNPEILDSNDALIVRSLLLASVVSHSLSICLQLNCH